MKLEVRSLERAHRKPVLLLSTALVWALAALTQHVSCIRCLLSLSLDGHAGQLEACLELKHIRRHSYKTDVGHSC